MSEQDVLNTLIGEAGSNPAGMTAVAYTILNRSAKFGQTPTTVVKAPNQYTGYSAPGWAAKRAQNDPQVQALAKQVWDAVQARSVPDPTKGGLNFRSDAAAAGLGHSPHGTKSIGGNTFQLGNSPSSALSAINTVAPPIPRARPTLDASAYANSSVPTLPAGPVPYDFLGRGGHSVEINPNGTPKVPQPQMQVPPGVMYGVNRLPGHPQEPTDFQANLGAPYSSSPFSTDWQIANALKLRPESHASIGTGRPTVPAPNLSNAPYGGGHFIPANARTYISTILGDKSPLSQGSFSQPEMQVLQGAVQNAEKNGRSYVKYEDFISSNPNGLRTDVLGDLTDTKKAMATTIGHAGFSRQPDGSILLKDSYDFGPGQTDWTINPDGTINQTGGDAAQEIKDKGIWGAFSDRLAQQGPYGALRLGGELAAPEGNGRPVAIRLNDALSAGGTLAGKAIPSIPLASSIGMGRPASVAPNSFPAAAVPPPLPRPRDASIGMLSPTTLDLNNRPVYFGNDGTYGTERSFSINVDGKEVLIPQIVSGKLLTQQQAVDHYFQTGENLGTFSSPAAADKYATQLHLRDQGLNGMPVPMPSRPAALSKSAVPSIPAARPSNITAEGLTIRPVTSVAIDPMTGNPVGSNVSRETPNLQTALNALAASKAASLGGSTKTTSNPAGSVPMPPGVVPKAAQTMLSQIAASQVNKSGSPDERGSYIPPSIPKPLSAGPTPAQLAAINDVSHVPVPGGVINPSGVKVAAGNVTGKNTDQLSPTLAYGPPGSVPPSVAAINAATVPLPRPRPTPVVPTIPARPPAAYPLTQVPNNGVNPFSQAGPQVASHVAQSGLGHIIQYLTGEPVQGGLLGMLPRLPAFAPNAPAQSAANPQIPYPTVGTSFLQSQGQNTSTMSPAQISNALRDALASSSRQSGSGPGSQ